MSKCVKMFEGGVTYMYVGFSTQISAYFDEKREHLITV